MKSTICHQVILFISMHLWTACACAVCDIKRQSPNINLAYSWIEAFQVNSSDPYDMDGISTQLNYHGKFWRASHEYLALDFPRDNLSTPVTNGDIHTLAMGYRNDINYDHSNNLHWEMLPTLATSSNQLKNIDEIKSSSFRLDGHFIWQARLQNNVSLFTGGCATTVTGDYELIPVAGFEYQKSDWGIYIGYPHTELDYSINPILSVFSSWALSGNQWEVLDKNLQNRNDVHLASKQVKLGFRFNFPSIGIIDTYWLHYYDQKMEYLTRNNSRISADMGNTNGWMIRYTYLI